MKKELHRVGYEMKEELHRVGEELLIVRRNTAGSCIDIFTRGGIYSKLNSSIQYHFFKDVMDVALYRAG